MTAYHEQRPVKEREEVISLIEKGEMSIHKGTAKLGIPYTTIKSRISRGSTIQEAFMDPIRERREMLGNAAWQALGDERADN